MLCDHYIRLAFEVLSTSCPLSHHCASYIHPRFVTNDRSQDNHPFSTQQFLQPGLRIKFALHTLFLFVLSQQRPCVL